MEKDLQEKQAYLRENVLEKGYDADEFMSFLKSKKGENGLDLNNWTLNELKNSVKLFILQKIDEEPGEEINKNDETENNANGDMAQVKENSNSNFINENNNEIRSQPKEENLEIEQCLISETTPLSKIDNVKIKLSSPKKIEGGLFQKSYILYEVFTEPYNYKTYKRYSDFDWLRKALSIIYPNCVLPPLTKKNIFGDNFSKGFISKRIRFIEKFMEGIFINPLVKNSELLNIFLSVENKNDFKKQTKKYENMKEITSVKKMKTLDGLINIGISKEKEIYLDNIKNYSKGNAEILDKIAKSFKSLMEIIYQLSNKMKSISQLFKDLHDKSIIYFDSHNTSETFNIMIKFLVDWANIQENQIKIMNLNLREYFKYVKNEFISLKEMANKTKNCKINYEKAKEKLLITKENLFQKQEVDLWQLKEEDKSKRLDLLRNKDLAFTKMLPNDTIKVAELKKFYGGMLNSLISEFERIRKINAKRHKDNIINFIKDLSIEFTNMHICLADRQTEFNQLKDENDIHNNDGSIQLKNVENLDDLHNDENANNLNNKNKISNNNFDFENIEYVGEEGNSNHKKSN